MYKFGGKEYQDEFDINPAGASVPLVFLDKPPLPRDCIAWTHE